MAQVIATGKWSKTRKNWTMVVSIQRPAKQSGGTDRSEGRGRPGPAKR